MKKPWSEQIIFGFQRSEVVALVNTLHRFSESLEAVNQFRKLWSESSATETEELIQEAEKVTTARPRHSPSPLAGREGPDNLLEEARTRVAALFRVCKESTVGCMAVLLNMWLKGVRAVSSVLRPSGKEYGPGGNFGDL